MRNLDNFRQAEESPKSGLLLSKKYILSAKVYIDDLSHITFKHLFKSSPSSSCNIWNHKSFFTAQLLCIFLAQTLHTFYKISTSKWKFLDFPLLALKFMKFLMSFFKEKLSLDHISVSWEIILRYLFSWNFICYWQK